MKTAVASLLQPVKEAHNQWGWYLAMGIAFVALGAYCLYATSAATLASVIVIGSVMMLAGFFQLAAAVMARGAGHVIFLLLIGALDIVAGLMLVSHPDIGAAVLTLFLAVTFVFGGLYRFVTALVLQFPSYGWAAFSALITLALGVMLWMQWPVSALWFIGMAVGINLVFAGMAWSSIAFKLKNIQI